MTETAEMETPQAQPGTLAKRRNKRDDLAARRNLPTYRDMVRDPNVALALALIKAPIFALDWRIECDDETAQEELTATVKRLWRDLVRTSMTAVEYGFAPHEKIWKLDAQGKPDLEQLNDLQPWYTTVVVDETTNRFAGLRYRPAGILGDAGAVFIPAEKCFVFTHGKAYGSLYGVSRLDPSVESWLDGRKARRDLAGYLQRKGDPPIKGRAPAETRHNANGSEIDCMEELMQNLLALESGGAAAFPSEYDDAGHPLWDAEYMEVPERATEFLDAIKYHDNRAFRGALVPEAVATHEEVGAYSAIAQYVETFMTIENLLAEDFLAHATKYIVQPLAALRYGPGVEVELTAESLASNMGERYRELIEKFLANGVTAPLVAEAVDLIEVIEGAGLPLTEPDGQAAAPAPARAALARRLRDARDRLFDTAMDDARDYYSWLMARVKKKPLQIENSPTCSTPHSEALTR